MYFANVESPANATSRKKTATLGQTVLRLARHMPEAGMPCARSKEVLTVWLSICYFILQ